jgi:hypothetical protein
MRMLICRCYIVDRDHVWTQWWKWITHVYVLQRNAMYWPPVGEYCTNISFWTLGFDSRYEVSTLLEDQSITQCLAGPLKNSSYARTNATSSKSLLRKTIEGEDRLKHDDQNYVPEAIDYVNIAFQSTSEKFILAVVGLRCIVSKSTFWLLRTGTRSTFY